MADKKRVHTIDDVRPPDRELGYSPITPRWYTKLFELLPALVTWGLLLLPVFFALLNWDRAFVFMMSFLTIYWGIKALMFLYGIFNTLSKMKRDVQIDWIQKIKDEGVENKNLKYVLIYPLVNEGPDTIIHALEGWINSTVDSKKISVVVALEEKYAKKTKKVIAPIFKRYEKDFAEIITAVHPANIEGEVQGVKGGNINWATRRFVDVVENRGEDLRDYLLISCDSDLIPHKKFLAGVTHKFLTADKPFNQTYSSGIHTFRNNIYRVPTLVRVFSNFITIAIMHQWGLWGRDANATFSAYVVPLWTVKQVHYWDPQLENDDTAFYWNARARLKGNFASEVVYIPTYNDAVENKDLINTFKSLWKQQVRWGWGMIVVPMTWSTVQSKAIFPMKERVKMFIKMFDDIFLFRSAIYLLTFAVPIASFINPAFKYSTASYSLQNLMGNILGAVALMNLPIYYVRTQIFPSPKEWKWYRHIWDLGESFLVIVAMLTFGFLPFLLAVSEMVFRKGPKTKHYATEKVKIGR